MLRRGVTILLLILLVLLGACASGGGGGGSNGGDAGSPDSTDPAPPDPPDACAGLPPSVCDTDQDGVVDALDVCTLTPDPAQCDSDADGYGNACDCDFDQDGSCGVSDDDLLAGALGAAGFGEMDMDCDALVNAADESLFDAGGDAPGPSGLGCAGSTPCPDPGLVFPATAWATASPASLGVDAAALQAALDYLDSVSGTDGIGEAMVIRNGLSIWEGIDVGQQHNVWSVTKSFTSTVMGVLVDQGLAGFGTLGASHVPGLQADYPTVTLRHFVTHGSGYNAIGGEQSSTPFSAAAPLFTPPGSRFLYWDAAINEFANVLTQIAGESLFEVFEREVAGPIGMPSGEWTWGDFGSQAGLLVNGGGGNNSKGIQTNARTLARLCHLFLARGSWDGTQVVASEWVAQATRNQVPNTLPQGSPSSIGPGAYGYGWFTNGVTPSGSRLWPDVPKRAYMAAGFNQNRCWVIPEWSMVVVRTGTNGGSYSVAEENEFLRRVGLAIQ